MNWWQRHLVEILMVGLIVVATLNVLGGSRWYELSALWQPMHSLVGKVIWTMRVPRLLASVMVGALLAMSGLLLQTVSHNPIADPSILGINAGANLALIVGGVLGVGMSIFNTVWLSLFGAGLAFLVVMSLAMSRHGIAPLRLILGGTVFSGFISCISYAISVMTNTTEQYRNLLVGGFSSSTYGQVGLLVIVLVIVIVTAACFQSGLTLLAMDATTTRGLGVSTGILWSIAASLIVLATAASVAVGGNIGFVGLGIPQLIQAIRPESFKQNIWVTLLGGSVFMTTADLIAKATVPGVELPMAALSALFGGCLLFMMVVFDRRVIQV